MKVKCGYWKAIPNDNDCLDALDYEVVYVYFDGKYSVYRMGMEQRFRLEDVKLIKLIEPEDTYD